MLIPTMNVSALPRDADLVIDDITLDPPYPEKGDSVAIIADVYNSGLKNTASFASIITIAYFVDDELRYVDEIGNIEPGIANKIQISSPPIWESDLGPHKIKVIVDYHNTLGDQYDSPDDNVIEEVFVIDNLIPTTLSLDISPGYFMPGTTIPNIAVMLVNSNDGVPLQNKKIMLSLDDVEIILTTDKNGKSSISSAITSVGSISVESFFAGDHEYSSSTSVSTIHSFSKNSVSAMLLEIVDTQNHLNFKDHMFDVIIFQDSYDVVIKKINSDSPVFLDSKTLLVPLSPGHDYFTEIYLNGRLFFTTDKEPLEKNTILIQEIKIPEPATIKFKVIDNENKPVSNAHVNTWIYSSVSGDDGLTDWMDVLPTFTENEPYIAKISMSDQKTVFSDPFLLFSGEKKIITVMVDDLLTSEIPDWVKNNAGWWADGQIDDSSFVQGIQHLIQSDIVQIPMTSVDISSDSSEIPDWVKNNAGWWADGQIDDSSFVQGIQHLIQEGIIVIS